MHASRRHSRCAYLPFGAGTRSRIGKRFAMWEAQAILATYVRRMRLLPTGDAPKVGRHFGVTLAPKPGAPLRVDVRG